MWLFDRIYGHKKKLAYLRLTFFLIGLIFVLEFTVSAVYLYGF